MSEQEHSNGCTCDGCQRYRAMFDAMAAEGLAPPRDDREPLVLVSAAFTRGSMLSLENGLEIPATILEIVGVAPAQLPGADAEERFTVFLNDSQMLYLSLMFLTEYGRRMLPDTPQEPPGG